MITRFFAASEEANRVRIERVLTLPVAEAQEILADLKGRYGVRHPDIDEIWMESFERVAALVPPSADMDDKRRMLIGAYFTMEYAVEAAALFNPSIVPAIDQRGLPPGCTRFLMSACPESVCKNSTTAITSSTWMNAPIVYVPTIPSSQAISRITARV